MINPFGAMLNPIRAGLGAFLPSLAGTAGMPAPALGAPASPPAHVNTPGSNGASGGTTASRRPGNEAWRQGIKNIESGGGDYSVVGARHPKYGRALGAYQVMEANLPQWTREAIGREVDAETFLRSPQIQDAVFDHKFGQYVAKHGEEGAARAWYAGEKGMTNLGATDVHGKLNVAEYGRQFMGNRAGRSDSRAPSSISGIGSPNDPMLQPRTQMAGFGDAPAGTQTLPTSGSRGGRVGGSLQTGSTEAAGLEAPATTHPVAQAFEQYRVNRTTRMLRGLSPAATIGVLSAIGADVRALRDANQKDIA